REPAEIGLPDDRGDERHDQVSHERVDDREEGDSHDHRYREIEHVPPQQEISELSKTHRTAPVLRSGGSPRMTRASYGGRARCDGLARVAEQLGDGDAPEASAVRF